MKSLTKDKRITTANPRTFFGSLGSVNQLKIDSNLKLQQ